MCSFWNTMEHDDGDLEAVVRAGRGYNSFASGRNSSYNWQLKGVQGFDPGSVFRSLQVPAELGDSGCNTNNNNNSMASVPAVMGHMNSSVMFPSLLRTAPPAMDLQDLVCSPFYGANVLRSASSSSSLFDSLDQVQAASSPIFGADSQTSLFSTERRSSDQSTQSAAAPVSAVGACKESEDDFGVDMSPTNNLPSQPAAAAVASDHQSGSSDLGSKPIKAEPITTDMSFHKEGDANSSFSQLKTDSGVENGSTQTGSNSTKNQGGSKRRKTQQKRIVCVPAAGGGNRPSGEGLPSDLWAWRKYGQKPIKGSPYPRGYYRCSSSKGCSARKQVERSRTDPSMMVITYTSDHNHPWPTHRNALAGSTRQTTSAEKMAASTDSPNNDQSSAGLNAASADENSDMVENPGGETNPFYSIMDSPEVAAEAQAVGSSPMDQTESFAITAGDGQAGINLFRCVETRHEDDFFAELGELPESLNVFARHFDDDKSDEEAACTHVVDPFNLFNWSSSTFVDTKTAM